MQPVYLFSVEALLSIASRVDARTTVLDVTTDIFRISDNIVDIPAVLSTTIEFPPSIPGRAL